MYPQQPPQFDMNPNVINYSIQPFNAVQSHILMPVISAAKQYVANKTASQDQINSITTSHLMANNGANVWFQKYAAHVTSIFQMTGNPQTAVQMSYTLIVYEIVQAASLFQQPHLVNEINAIQNAVNNINAQLQSVNRPVTNSGYQQPMMNNGYQQPMMNNQNNMGYNPYQQNNMQPQQPHLANNGLLQQSRPVVGSTVMVSSGNANETNNHSYSTRPVVGTEAIKSLNHNNNTQQQTTLPTGVRPFKSSLEPEFISKAIKTHDVKHAVEHDVYEGAPIAIKRNEGYAAYSSGGSVVKYVTKLEGLDKMHYSELETNAAALERNRPKDMPVGTAIWDSISNAAVVHVKPGNEEEIDDNSTVVLLDKEDTIIAPTLNHAVSRAYALGFSKYDIVPLDTRVFQHKCDIETPYFVSEEDHLVIKSLYDSKNMDELIVNLKHAREELDQRVYWAIEERLTRIFEDRVDSGLGVQMLLDSIVDDYESAKTGLINHLKPSQGFMQKWLATTHIYILHALRNKVHAKPDSVFDGETVFLTAVTVAHLPVPVSDLDLKLPNRFSLLTTKRHSNMLRFCKDVITRTTTKEGYPTVCKRFVRTIDNVWFEIAPNEMGEVAIKQIKLSMF